MKKVWISVLCSFWTYFTIQAQNPTFNQTPVIMDSTVNSSLLVCKLTGPEFQQRKSALQREVFAQVKELREVRDGFIFHFDDKENFVEKLVDFTLAEKKCCPFFQFDLKIRPNNKGIELGLRGPEGAKEMIKELVDNL